MSLSKFGKHQHLERSWNGFLRHQSTPQKISFLFHPQLKIPNSPHIKNSLKSKSRQVAEKCGQKPRCAKAIKTLCFTNWSFISLQNSEICYVTSKVSPKVSWKQGLYWGEITHFLQNLLNNHRNLPSKNTALFEICNPSTISCLLESFPKP